MIAYQPQHTRAQPNEAATDDLSAKLRSEGHGFAQALKELSNAMLQPQQARPAAAQPAASCADTAAPSSDPAQPAAHERRRTNETVPEKEQPAL